MLYPLETKAKIVQRCCVVLMLLCCLIPQSVSAQNVELTGTVVDNRGETVIGATVMVPGGKTGAVTNLDGVFKVNVKPGAVLTISYIGYKTLKVKAKNGMKVVLEDEQNNLNEVQVVGYGTQKKISVTGAVSNISGKSLTETPTGSIANVLAGALSGVSSVQQSGEPGRDRAVLYVRGMSTWNAENAQPLIQVDGVERDFNDLDPNEIESITVLKDASATAVYGVRGANGVILVTTKRGAEGKAKISANVNFSVVMPTKPVELANAYEYASYHNQMSANDGKTPQFTDAVLRRFKDHSDPIRYPDTDWTDYVLDDNTFQMQSNLNISGGTKKAKYFISLGQYAQDGMFKQFDLDYDCTYQYRRFNYRANFDFEISRTATFSMNVGGVIGRTQTPYSGQGASGWFKQLYYTTPFSSPGLIDGHPVYTTTDYDDDPLPFTGGNGLGYYGTGFIKNTNNRMNIDLIYNQKLDFVTPGLTFKLKGSYNGNFSVKQSAQQSLAQRFPVLLDDGTIAYRKTGEDEPLPAFTYDRGYGRNWYMDASFNYNRQFGLHHVGALALYNQSRSYYPSSYSSIPKGYVGMAMRVTYDWNNRYMAEFNAGYNGSENFAKDKRFGFFPAFSAGWVVSDEKFFKALTPVISFMKLRATFGLVGNDRISSQRFLYLPDEYTVNGGGLNPRGGYAYNFGINNSTAYSYAKEATKHNQDVTWEKSFKRNYGVDIYFLKDKLQASFDYFKEHRYDILLNDGTAPFLLGFKLPAANLGKVDSWGYEVSLKWNDRIGKNFVYHVGMNLSYNDNEIKEMKETPQNYSYMMQKGHRIGSRALYKFWKYYYEGCEADYEKAFGQSFPTQIVENIQPGDAVYVDLNGDGKITAEDQSYELGKTDQPRYTIGLNLGFTWRNLSLSARFVGAWDVSRLADGSFRRPFYRNDSDSQGGLLKVIYDNTWTADNPSQDCLYPRATWNNASQNYAGSTLYEQDSKYLRLKSLNVAYNFHFPFMRRLKMSSLALTLSAYNLFTITPFKWGDPESRINTAPDYPLTRTFSAGVKVGF